MAESISGRVRINPLNLTREYGAVDESSIFAVTLDDGSRISSSTSGLEEFITFKWKITESGAIVYEEAGELRSWCSLISNHLCSQLPTD